MPGPLLRPARGGRRIHGGHAMSARPVVRGNRGSNWNSDARVHRPILSTGSPADRSQPASASISASVSTSSCVTIRCWYRSNSCRPAAGQDRVGCGVWHRHGNPHSGWHSERARCAVKSSSIACIGPGCEQLRFGLPTRTHPSIWIPLLESAFDGRSAAPFTSSLFLRGLPGSSLRSSGTARVLADSQAEAGAAQPLCERRDVHGRSQAWRRKMGGSGVMVGVSGLSEAGRAGVCVRARPLRPPTDSAQGCEGSGVTVTLTGTVKILSLATPRLT